MDDTDTGTQKYFCSFSFYYAILFHIFYILTNTKGHSKSEDVCSDRKSVREEVIPGSLS